MTPEKRAGIDKIIKVLRKLLDPSSNEFCDEWLKALSDACLSELNDNESAAAVLQETDFLNHLLGLAAVTSGDLCQRALKNRSNSEIEICSFSDSFDLTESNRYDGSTNHRYFAAILKIFFPLLRHSKCVHLLHSQYFVETRPENAPSEIVSVVDFVAKLSRDSCQNNPVIFSVIFSTLKVVVSTEECFQWLIEETSFFRLALSCMLDSAQGPRVSKPTYYCRREARAFLVAAICARAANSSLGLFVHSLIDLLPRPSPRETAPSNSSEAVFSLTVLFECLQTAFLESDNTPEIMREIASVMRVNSDGRGVDRDTAVRNAMLLFLYGEEALAVGGALWKSVSPMDNHANYDKFSQFFQTLLSSINTQYFCKENSYLPFAYLMPVLALDPSDKSFEIKSFWTPKLLTKAVLRACQTLVISLEKGLKVENHEKVAPFILKTLRQSLTESGWTPHAFTAANEDQIRKALSGVVSLMLTKECILSSTSEIVALAEVLLELPTSDLDHQRTGMSCTALKSRLECLLSCFIVVHNRDCGTSTESLHVSYDLWLKKIVTLTQSIAEKDEAWENTDSIVEFYLRLFDDLNSHHENGCQSVPCKFYPLLESNICAWLVRLATEASQRFRGPSSSYVRATAMAALASLMAFCHKHDRRLGPITICRDSKSQESNDTGSAVEEVDNALKTEKAVNGTKVDIVDNDLVKNAQEVIIVGRMISFCSMRVETEAIVRRGAVDVLTRSLDQFFGNEAQDSILAKVVMAVGTASYADFDFDVKRKCVGFWKVFASKIIDRIAVLEKENKPDDGVSEGVTFCHNGERGSRISKEAVTEINDSSFKGLIDDMIGIRTEDAAKEGSISWRDEMDVLEGRLEAVYNCLFIMAKSDCEPCVQICAEVALSDLPSLNSQMEAFKTALGTSQSDTTPSPLLILDEIFKEVQYVPLQHVRFGDLDEVMLDCY